MKLSNPWKTEQRINTLYFHKNWLMTLNLETIFKAVHSTGKKKKLNGEWDQQIPAFAKLSLNDARENFCN